MYPEYLFETSWEVCNMMGGIYTVLSTKAATLSTHLGDKLVFIGPDVWENKKNPYFEEDSTLLSDWKNFAKTNSGLNIRIGRWKIPGTPIAVLVDFQPLFAQKDDIYSDMWLRFGINSIAAYGDYDECAMFSIAAGTIVESYYKFFGLNKKNKVVAHFNEWQTAFGVFYVKKNLPNVKTVFTTHATTIGRSIAGNHKPLYNYLTEYNGDQMAQELNVVSKHSAEKTAAHVADSFTTVSEITARECKYLLEKEPLVTPNGFEDDFVPKKNVFNKKRKEARESLRNVAEKLLGYTLPEDALFVGTAGRYEYKNKGIDVFVEAMKHTAELNTLGKTVVAFIMVPAHISGARKDLAAVLQQPEQKLYSWNRFTTHELYDYNNDNVMSVLRWFYLTNQEHERVKVIFVPSYLNGADGIFNRSYYQLLIGMDLTIFPSYYEPWGYTPLESVAFKIPTITTDLSGFGQWVSPTPQGIETGVGIIHRTDYNAYDVAKDIAQMLAVFSNFSDKQIAETRKNAAEIAEKALWKHFIQHYEKAYK
ncbi:MAG: glycogen/starch synthase [Prevotellaceae bacterium]|jgi:glycogen synthase|nr:glycogen/starch synthase [Prevotellaceae bacterium]